MSLNKLCSECDRRFSCQYPCPDYSNASYLHHVQKEAQNIQNAIIKTLNSDENTVVHKKNNPCIARVSEVDIPHETGVLWGLEMNDEKKEMLKKMLNKNQGCCIIPDPYFPKKHCENNIENFLEFDVSQHEYFLVMKGKKSITELIDRSSLLLYLEEQNDKFCEQEGLCPECRTPLQKYESKEEIWGSIQTAEVYWNCPRGC